MDESNAQVELRKTSDPLLYAWHAHEHHAGRALVKDGSHLFETSSGDNRYFRKISITALELPWCA